MSRTIPNLTFGTMIVSTIMACSAPTISLDVAPSLVCPGDWVTRTIQTDGHTGGRLTVTPRPVDGFGSLLFDRSEGGISDTREAQICETTQFEVQFWNGDESECGIRCNDCDEATVSVVFGEIPIELTSSTCGESAELTINEADYGSLQIRDVINCTGGRREVELTGEDGTRAVIPDGGSTAAFLGQPMAGSFTARRTVIPPEGCPPLGRIIPEESPPAPPPICLIFMAGCAATDDCPED